MNKDRLDKFVRLHGLIPEKKMTFREAEVFVADGFTMEPEKIDPTCVEPGEFPFGAFATTYWISKGEDVMMYGHVLFCDAMHDKEEGWTQERKKQARINTALEQAKGFLKAREKVRNG